MTKKINEYSNKSVSENDVKLWLSTYKPGSPIPDEMYQYYFSISEPGILQAEKNWDNL